MLREETHVQKVMGSNPGTGILDGHFFTYICFKNCNVCLKRLKINKKEAGVGPFYNIWREVLDRVNLINYSLRMILYNL